MFSYFDIIKLRPACPRISSTLKKQLKAKAHGLHPIVIIGDKGLTNNIVLETDRSLTAHELIKVRINATDRQARQQMANDLTQQCQAELLQIIGHIAIIYRKRIEQE